MKKLLLTLGSLAAVVAPVAAVVACDSGSENIESRTSTLTTAEIAAKANTDVEYDELKTTLGLDKDMPNIMVEDIGWTHFDTVQYTFENGILDVSVKLRDVAAGRGEKVQHIKVRITTADATK